MFKITIITVQSPQHTHLLYFVYFVDVLVDIELLIILLFYCICMPEF